MGMPEHPHNYAWNRYIGAVLFKFYSIEFHSIGDGPLSDRHTPGRLPDTPVCLLDTPTYLRHFGRLGDAWVSLHASEVCR